MDESNLIRVPARVHGRALLRRASEARAPLLVGFHGYGENAERLLEAIVEIPSISTWHVAVIQALHRFYNSKTGEVIASWMTKQDRELAIEDNIRYVGRTLEEIKSRFDVAGPVVFLGFSQGTAMAYRAAGFAGHECTGLIALAGDMPPELTSADARAIPRVLIGLGTRDTLYNVSKLESDVARLEGRGTVVETCVFEGGHEWTAEFRAAARDFLRSL